jgi:hypothetical protein
MGDVAVLSPVASEPLVFPPDLTQSLQYLDDQLAFIRDDSYLADTGFGSLAAKIRNDHIPRARYVQDQLNNHYDAGPVYQLVYQDALGSIAATHLIFTFEMVT